MSNIVDCAQLDAAELCDAPNVAASSKPWSESTNVRDSKQNVQRTETYRLGGWSGFEVTISTLTIDNGKLCLK